MLQKESLSVPIDKNNIWIVKIFHIYKGFRRKCGLYGDFIKISVKKTKPISLISKGSKNNAIIINCRYKNSKNDGSYLLFKINGSVLLKKRLTPRGRELVGPIPFTIKRKKFSHTFVSII